MPGVWVFPGGAVDDADRGADDDATYRTCAARELHEEAGIDLGEDPEMILWSRWITPEVVPIRFDTWFYLALAPPHSPPEPDGSETVDAGWFEPAAALASCRAGELDLVFPTIKQLEALAEFATAEERWGRPAGRRSRRSCRRSRARPASAASCCPASRATELSRPASRSILGSMTATLPDEVRETFSRLHHLRVHDDRRTPAADRLAGESLLRRRRRDDRRHHRARLPEEGERRPCQPAGQPVLLRPDRLGGRRRPPGARPGHGRGRRPRPGRQPRAVLAGVRREAAGDEGHATPEADTRDLQLVLHAPLREGPARARLPLARRRSREAAGGDRLAPGGGALRPRRGTAGATRSPRGREPRLGRADRSSSATATRTRCSPGSLPTGSRSRPACRSSPSRRWSASPSATAPSAFRSPRAAPA